MKRLLAYLIVVLGLGLTFNTPSSAAASLCIYKMGNYIHFNKQSDKKSCNGYVLTKKMNKQLYNRIKWLGGISKGSGNNYGEPWNINREENHFNSSVESHLYFISANHDDPKWESFLKKNLGFTFKRKNFFRKKNSGELLSVGGTIGEKIQIAKVEPSQTQKVAANESNRLCVSTSFNADYRFSNTDCKDSEREIQKGSDEYYEAQAFIEISNNVVSKSQKTTPVLKKTIKKTSNKDFKTFDGMAFCLGSGEIPWIGNKKLFWNASYWNSYCNPVSLSKYISTKFDYYFKNSYRWGKTDQELFVTLKTNLISQIEMYNFDLNELESFIQNNPKYAKFEPSKTQIAKTEATVKPEKKVKVVKKEPKQEEFKPKNTNQDNEAPVIEIAEAITVNDTDYEFQGKVTDKAKTIYVEVDGRPTDVKNGKFTVKGYSPIDKQISIEAIDQWGNRSKPKIVKLTIDIKDTSIAEKLEPLNPSKIRSKSSNNKVALIIGIENYLESPNATYANLDAKYFFDYARKGFGVKKQNINLLVDEQATFVKTNKVLTKWLRSKIKSGETELIIFFAGHGLASNDGKELYLLPQDSDPDLLARTALSRTELFKEIIALNPKSVTMFLDTCYSGVSRDEKTLLASARPVRIVADEQDTPDNFTIFSASQLDQISSGLKEAKHGIFSYYLMKGLEGKADANKDKNITNGELLAYMDQNVAQKASELGRQQNPSLAGDPDKILMSYR